MNIFFLFRDFAVRKIFYNTEEKKKPFINKEENLIFKSDERFLDLMHKTSFINETIYYGEEMNQSREGLLHGLNMTKAKMFNTKQNMISDNSNSLMVGFNNLSTFDLERQN